jgi:hypothetical protein
MGKTGYKHQICNGKNAPKNPENMECHSQKFLIRLQQNIAEYRYVLLDFLPAHIKKRHAHYHLDLLVSKEQYNTLLSVLSGAESLHFLRTRMHRHTQEIELVFKDLSHLSILLHTGLHFGNLSFVQPEEVFACSQFRYGFKVPSLSHAFEYHLLKSLHEKKDFPQGYSEYFSHCTFEERSSIFASIVPKYKFVINKLDDLMHYKPKNWRQIKKSLQKMKLNKGFYWFKRQVYPVSGWISTLLFGRWNYFYPTDASLSSSVTIGDFLIRKAYLRVG